MYWYVQNRDWLGGTSLAPLWLSPQEMKIITEGILMKIPDFLEFFESSKIIHGAFLISMNTLVQTTPCGNEKFGSKKNENLGKSQSNLRFYKKWGCSINRNIVENQWIQPSLWFIDFLICYHWFSVNTSKGFQGMFWTIEIDNHNINEYRNVEFCWTKFNGNEG